MFTGLYSDELNDLSDDLQRLEFVSSDITPSNSTINRLFWRQSYTFINSANSIIEGLRESPTQFRDKRPGVGRGLDDKGINPFLFG